MEQELREIRELATGTDLPADVQKAVLWGLDQLPRLYTELNRTYESRHSDRIVGLVQGMVKTLTAAEAGPDAKALAPALVDRLRAMHDRHGIAVALKALPAPKPSRKKKVG